MWDMYQLSTYENASRVIWIFSKLNIPRQHLRGRTFLVWDLMCWRGLTLKQWVRQRVIHADEEKDLGLPTCRANTSIRPLIQLHASRRTHFYHAFERVVSPSPLSVLLMSGRFLKSHIQHPCCFLLRAIHTLQLTPTIRKSIDM